MPSDSADIRSNDLLSSIEIKDQNDYIITKSTGWIEKLNHKRIGAAAEMKQVEELTFVIKKNKRAAGHLINYNFSPGATFLHLSCHLYRCRNTR